jgi:hypothetical protein
MTASEIRDQLHHQIDTLPDDIVQVVADFASFVMTRRQIIPTYADWDSNQWHEFALGQFFREDDEVEYTLNDAQEIYKP